ncbi:phenylacetate--CoA ligase family protein [Methanooceanicella nereidis]|uniref:phenylacetate--CoA ligase family protein n=1 Tax=Methanooceanicella nereidis TaxID=2052831 RepID=UPI0034E267CB
MSRKELEELQGKRLKAVVKRVYDNNPFYRKKFDEKGITPDDIKSINDVHKLPFTDKTDIRDNYPYGLLSVPKRDIVRMHASSGTTGKPTAVFYTKNDIAVWAKMFARCLDVVGVTKEDVVQVTPGYGLFTGGLGFHYGVEELGAMVIPIGPGDTRKQIEMMKDFGTTVLCGTVTYSLRIAEVCRDIGIDPKDLGLKIGVFGAEHWSNAMRNQIENIFGFEAFDIYGLSEMCGPGVGIDCRQHEGIHIWEDHFLLEVIDKNGEPCGEGERGEIVLTPLTKEGMPLLRYRTRDLSRIIGECSCGMTHRIIDRVHGRTDDMIIVRGVNVFPGQIESVLMNHPDIGPEWYAYAYRTDYSSLDHLKIKVEAQKSTKELLQIRDVMIRDLTSTLMGLKPELEFVPVGTLPRQEKKTKRLIDQRNY